MLQSKAHSVRLIAACASVMMINVTCSGGISIALPSIGQEFGIPIERLQWVISAYSLATGSLYILFGRLADLYGRKKLFLAGLAWMTAFSIGCGFAPNDVTLILLRAFQGIGMAAVLPATAGILAHSFDADSRGRRLAFATFSAGAPLGGAIGSILGGVLTQDTRESWRSFFFILAGLCILSFIGGAISVDPDSTQSGINTRVDWTGAALVSVGIVLVTFALGQAPFATDGWRTPYIGALLSLGISFILTFVGWERYCEQWTSRPPLVPLELLTRANGKFAVILAMALLDWGAFISWNTWVTVHRPSLVTFLTILIEYQLYYQEYEHLAPIPTMLRFIPMAVTGLVLNVVVALIVGFLPAFVLLASGCAMTGIAALLFALIKPSVAYWAFGFPAMILSVFGADFLFAGGSIFIARIAHEDEQSLAGGLFQTFNQFGAALYLAITNIVFNSVVAKRSTVQGADALLDGYQAAQWMNFGCAMLVALLAVLFFRSVGVIGSETRDNDPKGDPDINVRGAHKLHISTKERDTP